MQPLINILIMFLNVQEMNLIYDLIRHVEQLHYEMSDLQKSMKSCMEMQVQLQHSIEQKVSSAGHSSGEQKILCIC